MKITPYDDRVRVRLVDPRKEKSEGGIIIPNIAQAEPKVFEAIVLDVAPNIQYRDDAPKVGDRVLIPARILGDRCSDNTVFVKFHEIFGKVEDSLLVETGGLVLATK